MQLTLIVLLVLIPSITTLKCYVCNSNEKSACASDGKLNEKLTQTCPSNMEDPYCRKMVQTVNGDTSIVRSCGSKIGSKECYKTPGVNTANVCSCKTDLCNNAPSFNRQQQMMTILSSFIVVATAMIFLR
ncbi:unnamed protein product [Adineta steineri]|uniref:Protein sleepless n=1 Tax=Adineta steineri TaxID=433720 RepID=A0A814HPW8_9BILA|nr:unnamed protein product [Adineta steineri]CAF1371070.1 unnamed protein product [Adineta steineri]